MLLYMCTCVFILTVYVCVHVMCYRYKQRMASKFKIPSQFNRMDPLTIFSTFALINFLPKNMTFFIPFLTFVTVSIYILWWVCPGQVIYLFNMLTKNGK